MVKYQGQMLSLTDLNILNLPEIVKREILYPKLNNKEFGTIERQKTVSRIISMFQIKFDSLEAQNLAMSEYGSFLRGYSLTSEEVLEAYRMCAKLELTDFKGEIIKFYPNLSIGQLGEILRAYIDYKTGNQQHTKGVEKIKAFLNPPPEVSPEEKKAIKKANWDKMINAAKEDKECTHAFLFYEYFVKKGAFSKFLQDQNAQSIKIEQKMKFILNSEKKKIKNAIFKKDELEILSNFLYENKPSKSSCIERLQNMATVEVKNDLVFNHVKKIIKK